MYPYFYKKISKSLVPEDQNAVEWLIVGVNGLLLVFRGLCGFLLVGYGLFGRFWDWNTFDAFLRFILFMLSILLFPRTHSNKSFLMQLAINPIHITDYLFDQLLSLLRNLLTIVYNNCANTYLYDVEFGKKPKTHLSLSRWLHTG